MDLRLVARLTTAAPSRVVSQIRINFSMVLNLLLSHSLEQIEDLLHRSFAAFLLEKRKSSKNRKNAFKSAHRYLWNDFIRHFNFLVRKGYVAESGRLTPDGIWAAKLRIDQPLLLAESFRLGILPESDPALLAAVTAVFVNERESDEHIPKNYIPRKLQQTFLNLKKSLAPFIRQMTARGFFVPPLFFRPAVSMHAWAFGFPWEKVLELAECEEGDLAMQVLRTADNLRHIRALEQVFPRAAQTAGEAIEMILREPVVMDYDL